MPASKKPRKRYVPKPVLRNPLAFVMAGVGPLEPGFKSGTACRYYEALRALTHGEGTRLHWQELADMLNITNVIATNLGIGKEFLPDIVNAQRSHNECGIRKLDKGAFGYTGEQLKAVRIAADLHDQMLELVSCSQYFNAQLEVERRIGKGLCAFSPRKDYAARATGLQQQGICAVSPIN